MAELDGNNDERCSGGVRQCHVRGTKTRQRQAAGYFTPLIFAGPPPIIRSSPSSSNTLRFFGRVPGLMIRASLLNYGQRVFCDVDYEFSEDA